MREYLIYEEYLMYFNLIAVGFVFMDAILAMFLVLGRKSLSRLALTRCTTFSISC